MFLEAGNAFRKGYVEAEIYDLQFKGQKVFLWKTRTSFLRNLFDGVLPNNRRGPK